MASPSFIDKGPSVDWSTDDNLHNCSKMWKRRCELSPGRWRKLKKKSNASICYTRRENMESNFSTAGTCLRMTWKSWTITRWDLKMCQATLQWVNNNVGASPLPTRYPLSGIIYCKTENPCEGGQLSDRAQWSIHEGFLCAKNELRPFSKGLLQRRKCFHLQGRSWYGEVRRVGRQTAWVKNITGLGRFC